MYIVTAIRDTYEIENGVEIVGVFNTEEKAFKAKAKVIDWMKKEEYEDYEVFVSPISVNNIDWYEIEENI